MTRNQTRGGDRVSSPRSHAWRHRTTAALRPSPFAERVAPDPGCGGPDPGVPGRSAITDTERPGSADYLSPGRDPVLERHAVVLTVAALGQRRLPELQRLEVGLRRVGVVGGAATLLDLVHVGAGQPVC